MAPVLVQGSGCLGPQRGLLAVLLGTVALLGTDPEPSGHSFPLQAPGRIGRLPAQQLLSPTLPVPLGKDVQTGVYCRLEVENYKILGSFPLRYLFYCLCM